MTGCDRFSPIRMTTFSMNDRAQSSGVSDFVSRVVRSEIRKLSAYSVAKSEPGLIKLDAMENPYALPADLRARIARRLAGIPVNRYPEGRADVVKDALRAIGQEPTDTVVAMPATLPAGRTPMAPDTAAAAPVAQEPADRPAASPAVRLPAPSQLAPLRAAARVGHRGVSPAAS